MQSRRCQKLQDSVSLTYGDQIFEGRPLTVAIAEPIFRNAKGDGAQLTRSLTAATFGLDENVLSEMPWALYSKLVELQLEINELKPAQETTGETTGETQATAESTSA